MLPKLTPSPMTALATASGRLGMLLFSVLLQSCATIPDTQATLAELATQAQPLQVTGANNPLSPGKVKQALNKLSPDEEIRASLAQHLAIEQSIAGTQLYADNQVKLLFNGEVTFGTMKQAISAAQNHINLEYFTFEDVDLGGITLKKLLISKLAQGVKVNLIYDAIGSLATPPALFEELKQAGASISVYHPVKPGFLTVINQRDHRKLMVIDGKLAIIGGVNLSKTYQSKGSLRLFRKHQPLDLNNAHWRDTDAVIEGPAVAEIQRTFIQHWDTQQPLDSTQFFPPLSAKGQHIVRVIATNAVKSKATDSPYYVTLIAAINNAERSILLNAAYFVPTPAQEQALINAAARGVNVRLLVPSISDSVLSLNVQRAHYMHLLKHGVSIYEMQEEVLHAKVVSIDGVWSVIGSSNFDYRSAGLNAEIDFVILGSEVANALTARFNDDIGRARKIELESWKNRPLSDKVKQQLSRIFEGIL